MNENQHVTVDYLQETMKIGINRLVKNTSKQFPIVHRGGH